MAVFVLKLAVLTCIFYLAGAAVIACAVLLAVRALGGFMVLRSPWAWGLLFGPIWAASFALACRLLGN